MKSTRDLILSAVRTGLGDRRRAPSAIAAEADALLADPAAIRPRLTAAGMVESFRAKAAGLGTTTDRVETFEDIPAAVGQYLAGHDLPMSAAIQQTDELVRLPWDAVTAETVIAPDQPVAVGVALWGIAESGSVVIHSAPDTPVLLAFLPLHHIVVLRTARILAHLEDYASRLGSDGAHPRNAVIVTGPSGTTDIEGSYVRGAHGPGFVHVILVDEARPLAT